jgi:hypothetical protein
MKIMWYGFLVGILAGIPAVSGRMTVNGEITHIDSFRVLRVWGTHEQMGFAHGYLLGDEIVELFERYIMSIISPIAYENIAKPSFRQWITIPEPYQTELENIFDGIVASGTGIYSPSLNRDLTVEDLGIVNSIVDFSVLVSGEPFGCSTVCGWAEGTATDTAVPGGTIHCRNLDWTDTADRLLGKRSLIIAYMPSSPARQEWFAVTFPGFAACLSGMNSNGLGATLNMGNNSVTPGNVSGVIPICFQIREALETVDPDGDGRPAVEDIEHILLNNDRLPSTIIHAFGTSEAANELDEPSLIVESNHVGITRRVTQDDPVLAPFFLAATNHHRVLYDPVDCWRYTTIRNMVTETGVMDTGRAWSIAGAVAGSWTVQTMLFRPDIPDIFVSVTTDDTPAPQHTPSHLAWSELFIIPPPTPTPGITGVTITMPAHQYRPGDICYCTVTVTNGDLEPLIDHPMFLILDVYGEIFFAPSFTTDFDYYSGPWPAGTTPVDALPVFTWPDTGTSASGIVWYAALTDPAVTRIVGEWDSWEFGWL